MPILPRPQVKYVRIPDPDCKENISKCQQVMLPVDGFKLRTELSAYDKDQNLVLDAADLRDDPRMAIPAKATQRLAEIVTGVQYLHDTLHKFKSPEAIVDFARAEIAITKAYDTVRFLQSLPSLELNDGEVEYNPQDWAAIVARLGIGGNAYTDQVDAAHASFAQFVASANLDNLKFEHVSCLPGMISTCRDVKTAWHLYATLLPLQLQLHVVGLVQKVAVISAFVVNGEIECEGMGCPSKSESRSPSGTHWHGPRVSVDSSYSYLPEVLATLLFATTS